MRIMLIGDIVGKPGRQIVGRAVPALVERERIDLVIANAENAAGGSGITPQMYQELISAGVDCVTLGDHIYKRAEIIDVLNREENILKPANFPADAPGREAAILKARDGTSVAVVSLLGRVFMRPVDCPWKAADRVLAAIPPEVKVIVIDFHGEATSDKQLMGRYLDGRVSAVLGTHTHVPTADEEILPGGTAMQCDVASSVAGSTASWRRRLRLIRLTLKWPLETCDSTELSSTSIRPLAARPRSDVVRFDKRKSIAGRNPLNPWGGTGWRCGGLIPAPAPRL
jgi:metallophosphoesterase (TIGR00282 family)